MEEKLDAMGMLDLMDRPGFCVKDNKIVKLNQAAVSHMLTEGMDVQELLATGKEEYAAFQDGCLYVTLWVCGTSLGASVTRMGDFHIFLLEQEADQAELQAMALAAQELRSPLTNIMSTADRLFPMVALQNDPATREQVASINRGLLQMLRVISNMSDANRYSNESLTHQEIIDVGKFLNEILARSADLAAHAGIQLSFQNLTDPVLSLVDAEKLERAVLNILSNAIKHTPSGGHIDASLTRRGKMLYLRVQDNGQGIPENAKGSIYRRHLRQPGLESGNLGIGLGMVLIRIAAASHGGTVLIDQPEGCGTRITMTMAIRQNQDTVVRSKVKRPDYLGERNHSLIELSDALPVALYDVSEIN